MVELEEGIRLKNGKVVAVVELEEGIRLKNEKVVAWRWWNWKKESDLRMRRWW